MSLTYRDAGVDIDRGEALIERIKPLAAKTRRPEVVGGVGGFAGLFAIPTGYRAPILVSGTDGVGTKLMVAHAHGNHRGIGIDLVAMAVNDIITVGAEPLFFLDYFATGSLDVELATEVIAGIADGCAEAGCTLLGGETAELPGLYRGKDYDLAGFAVGVVERDEIITGKTIAVGDSVIGLPSKGIHSNGYSLARRALHDELGLEVAATPAMLGGKTLGDEMLEPTAIYTSPIAALLASGIEIRGLSHITGGGLIENPPRMFADDKLAMRIELDSFPRPAIFDLIASAGVEESEMRRTFNLGLGMLAVLPASAATPALALLEQGGHHAYKVGEIVGRTEAAVEFSKA